MDRNWEIIIRSLMCPNVLCVNHNTQLKCTHKNNYYENCEKSKCPIKLKERNYNESEG